MLRALLLALCGLALLAAAAPAQDDEIHVDPGSPSGKEYALPVDSARTAAAKGSGTKASDGQAPPLFGEGVQSAGGAGAGAKGSSNSAQGAKGGSSGGAANDGGTPRSAAPAPATVRAQAATPDGGNALAIILGVGAGVLLAGGLIGLALRRRAAR